MKKVNQAVDGRGATVPRRWVEVVDIRFGDIPAARRANESVDIAFKNSNLEVKLVALQTKMSRRRIERG